MEGDLFFGGLLRTRGQGPTRATYVELFFDLVFVFSITQVSRFLVGHFDLIGLAESVFLTLAVWWLWIYTSRGISLLDPHKAAFRALLFALMAASLVLSASIPDAFGERGIFFAFAYVFIQLARTGFLLACMRGQDAAGYRNFLRMASWLGLSAVFWITGGFLTEEGRWLFWAIALMLEFISPALAFFVPGLGRSASEDWNAPDGRFVERSALFIMLALGQSLILTAIFFAAVPWTIATFLAFAVGFGGLAALWRLYFRVAADEGPDEPERPSSVYLHIPLVFGIVLAPVTAHVLLTHDGGHVGLLDAIAILGGPFAFLAGDLGFRYFRTGELPQSHIAGLALLGGVVVIVPLASPLLLAAVATLILLITGGWRNSYARMAQPMDANWRSKKR